MTIDEPHRLYAQLTNNSAFEGKDLMIRHTVVLIHFKLIQFKIVVFFFATNKQSHRQSTTNYTTKICLLFHYSNTTIVNNDHHWNFFIS